MGLAIPPSDCHLIPHNSHSPFTPNIRSIRPLTFGNIPLLALLKVHSLLLDLVKLVKVRIESVVKILYITSWMQDFPWMRTLPAFAGFEDDEEGIQPGDEARIFVQVVKLMLISAPDGVEDIVVLANKPEGLVFRRSKRSSPASWFPKLVDRGMAWPSKLYLSMVRSLTPARRRNVGARSVCVLTRSVL
ncbi:hypothetical protein KC347_g262 [Hortaea werneckii]|nr:hypothetical protein KC347_g262 [Hortaea werneckii]